MAGHERETDAYEGFGRSDIKTFTIANGVTGSANAAVDLGRNYAYIIVRCDDCQYIQAATTLGVKVADDENQTLASVYEYSSNALTLLAPTLPTSGSMRFLLVPAFGAQYVHFTLSQATSGGAAVFNVYGMAESVQG